MPDYEITFPAAEGMLAQERATSIPPLEWYAGGTLARRVAEQIGRDIWLSYHHSRIDQVLALVEHLGNNPGWQEALLREALLALEHRGTVAAREKYDITVRLRHCPHAIRRLGDADFPRCRYCGENHAVRPWVGESE